VPHGAGAVDERQTARLLLTRMSEADLPELRRMHQDPRVMATLGGVQPPERVESWVRAQLAHWREHGFGWWTLRDRAAGRFAGRGGLLRTTVDDRSEVEIGYGLVPGFWGHGLATELATECVRVAFDVLDLPDVVSFTLPSNAASRRVMDKAGLRYERDFIRAGLPHVLYRLTR
jgi:ribosomal-protein-alanine N-acetyltransferase